jgi:hypothetical protein
MSNIGKSPYLERSPFRSDEMITIGADIPDQVQKVLSALDVISKIPKNHKLNIYNQKYVSADIDIYTLDYWLRRGFRESGTKTTDYIKEIIKKSINCGREYPEYGKTICNAIVASRSGINNLYEVYISEPIVIGAIEVIRLMVERDNFLKAIQTLPSDQVKLSEPIPIMKNQEPDNEVVNFVTPDS